VQGSQLLHDSHLETCMGNASEIRDQHENMELFLIFRHIARSEIHETNFITLQYA